MFNTMFPELHVSDCEKAAHFFEEVLGYVRGYSLMENGVLDYVVMEHPDPGLQLTLHRMLPESESDKKRTVRLYYEPKDIDSMVAAIRSKGFVVDGPKPTTYGAVVAHIQGPDGYEIVLQYWNKKENS